MTDPLPGHIHRYRFRTVEKVELKVACAEHGSWHTWPLKAEYRAGTVICRSHSHHKAELLRIEIQEHAFETAWEAHSKAYLTPAYVNAITVKG